MARTAQQQLDDLDALIQAIERSPNQMTVIHGQTYSKHQLQGLYEERRDLRREARLEARGNALSGQRIVPLG